MQYSHVFIVFDSKADSYLQPFFAPNAAVAQRLFSDVVRQPDHQFHMHAEDFTLFESAVFDHDTGKWVTYDAPKSICTALHVRGSLQSSQQPALSSLADGVLSPLSMGRNVPAPDGKEIK